MFIEVNKIAPEGLRIDRSLKLRPILQAGGDPAPVVTARVSGSFGRLDGDFVFRGRVEAVVTLACSRCLADFPHATAETCHRIYRIGGLNGPESRGVLAEDDLAVTPFDGDRIDLDEMVREQVYLVLPLKPLCKEDCGGLCSQCGANRNLAPCDCPSDPAEPEPLTLKIPL